MIIPSLFRARFVVTNERSTERYKHLRELLSVSNFTLLGIRERIHFAPVLADSNYLAPSLSPRSLTLAALL
jgi:hypothetical protein